MKKLLFFLSLSLSFLIAILPLFVQAGPITNCDASKAAADPDLSEICSGEGASCDITSGNCAICCVLSAILTVKNWIYGAALAISTVMVIYGGFLITTAGGSPENVNKGRQYITYAMIGFLVALLANAIPAIVKGLLGATST